mgnify:CR=1 FL=1
MRVCEVGIGRYPPAVVTDINDTVLKVLRGLSDAWVRHAVLVDEEGKLAGMISARDIVSFLGGGARFRIVEEEYGKDLYKALREVRAHELSYVAPRIRCEDEFSRVIEVMLQKGVGALAVIDNDSRPIGIISERHIMALFADVRTNVYVREVMSSPLLSMRPEEPLIKGMRLMISRHIRRVPLVEEGKLCGILTIKDVVAFFSSVSTQRRLREEGTEGVWLTPLSFLGAKRVATVSVDEDIGHAIRIMRDLGVGSLVVVDREGWPIGMFTERDVITKLPKLEGVEVFVDEIEKRIVAERVYFR